MSKPLLEVIIPIRNLPIKCFRLFSSLDRELKRVKPNQVHITVVDDASTDETFLAVSRFIEERKETWAVMSLDKRKCIGGARNVALHSTDSDYVVYFDADDDVVEGALAKICDILENKKPEALVWGFTRKNEGVVQPISIWLPNFERPEAFVFAPCGVWVKAIRRDKCIDFREGVFCEDVCWWFKTADGIDPAKVEVIKEPLYIYERQRGCFSEAIDLFMSCPMTLEHLAFADELDKRGLNDKCPSDALRNLAAMYDLRKELKKPYVKQAWGQRFHSEYVNILSGRWSF